MLISFWLQPCFNHLQNFSNFVRGGAWLSEDVSYTLTFSSCSCWVSFCLWAEVQSIQVDCGFVSNFPEQLNPKLQASCSLGTSWAFSLTEVIIIIFIIILLPSEHRFCQRATAEAFYWGGVWFYFECGLTGEVSVETQAVTCLFFFLACKDWFDTTCWNKVIYISYAHSRPPFAADYIE